MPYGSRARGDRGASRRGSSTRPRQRGRVGRAARTAAASRMAARRSPTSRISSWSDSNPPNVRLVSRATTSSRSPSWTTSAMSARPNAMPSSTSRSRRSVSWRVAAGRRADAGHGQPEDRDERLRVARAARREAARARGTARSRRRAPGSARSIATDGARIRRRRPSAAMRLEPLDERGPALGRRARSRPRRRGRRSG